MAAPITVTVSLACGLIFTTKFLLEHIMENQVITNTCTIRVVLPEQVSITVRMKFQLHQIIYQF